MFKYLLKLILKILVIIFKSKKLINKKLVFKYNEKYLNI